ncbi:MAG: multicopper oxidase family protein [Hyphomicrobiales bacterium]
MAGGAALFVGRAAAEDVYSGQYISAEPLKRPLMGPEVPPTAIQQFRTAGKLPILRARQGREVRFRVISTLEEELWLHFFGVRGPSDMMTVQVGPSSQTSLEVAFTPPDAGLFWFGPLLNASRQRDMGLYGLLIVDEADPVETFNDVPLIIDDWMLDEDGKMDTDFGNLDVAIADGRIGNWFTVNGDYKPTLTMRRDARTRLRLLNACNARDLSLTFKNLDLTLLAEDGQPVQPHPLGGERYGLSPGQRADFLVTGVLDRGTLNIDLSADTVEAAVFAGEGGAVPPLAADFRLPANPLPIADAALARTVAIAIEGGAKGGLQSAKVGDAILDLRQLLEKGLAWAFNGVAGPGGPLLFEAKKGESLILAFDNKTGFAQPLHIHGHVWQVVEQDGRPVTGAGFRDTVVITALSSAKVLLAAVNPGSWAIQSLVAERCDAGLLGGFAVSETP